MKIVFLVRSLNRGGAERQLVILAQGLHARGHAVHVMVFYPGGPLEQELIQSGIPVLNLKKAGRWDVLPFLWRAVKLLRAEQPDILHSYLNGANLIALVLRMAVPRTKVVWGIRASDNDLTQYDWLAIATFKLSCRISRGADGVIANSQVGRDYHVSKGYPSQKMVVIPNGIDTERFCPSAEARQRLRVEWGLSNEHKLVGLVGRLHPIKDHPSFLKAVAQLAPTQPYIRFVCVGGDRYGYQTKLLDQARALGIEHLIRWAGVRDDMPAVYNALDLLVNCSTAEGLPNVVGEAMACGVPCVVTDVGDSAWVVGRTGAIVPLSNPTALASAVRELLDTTCDRVAIRQQILSRLSITQLVSSTELIFARLLTHDDSSVQPLTVSSAGMTKDGLS
jgi:glycosyltransferase involved in cell wall biosynthesis